MASALPSWKPSSSAPSWGGSSRSPPWVRSRSQGRPLASWSLSDCSRYCCSTQTSSTPEWTQLDRGKVDQPVHAGEGERRLGPPLGEQLQPASLTAGQHEREHLELGHRRPG